MSVRDPTLALPTPPNTEGLWTLGTSPNPPPVPPNLSFGTTGGLVRDGRSVQHITEPGGRTVMGRNRADGHGFRVPRNSLRPLSEGKSPSCGFDRTAELWWMDPPASVYHPIAMLWMVVVVVVVQEFLFVGPSFSIPWGPGSKHHPRPASEKCVSAAHGQHHPLVVPIPSASVTGQWRPIV